MYELEDHARSVMTGYFLEMDSKHLKICRRQVAHPLQIAWILMLENGPYLLMGVEVATEDKRAHCTPTSLKGAIYQCEVL